MRAKRPCNRKMEHGSRAAHQKLAACQRLHFRASSS
jgi:hypothetical protein